MRKNQMAFENQHVLKFYDPGGINALPSGCGKLGMCDMEMKPIGHFRKYQCWWNGGHSPCPHQGKMLKCWSMGFNVNQPR
jgi:hypothetical protein